jgi:UDP-GlcNAc:undecaprenyl-phosphate GlcNAc-1-phosphate transferase
MLLASTLHLSLALFIPAVLPGWALLLLGAIGAFLLTYALTFGVKALCIRMNWLDRPAERRVHKIPVPRLGGVAIYLAFAIISLLLYVPGPQNEINIYWLLLIAGFVTVVVHAYDDVMGLGPWPKLIAQTLAVLLILGPWNGQFHGVLLFTVNNPFGQHIANPALPWYQQPTIELLINSQLISWAAIPAILLTWFWTVGMMNTVNWIDGMDGLATGVVGITAFFVTIISLMLGQQSIAVLAAIFTGAVFGFLPHNWNPARVFMGDSGAMFLGLALAVLSIMGGAKLALALMVLGVPILDVALVILNRLRRGQSPLHYDKTHLHHRLLSMGFSVRQICYLLYGLALTFGLLAVGISGLQVGASAHFSKLIGIGLVVVAMIALIIWADRRQRQRGAFIKLDGPENTPGAMSPKDMAPNTETKLTGYNSSPSADEHQYHGILAAPPLRIAQPGEHEPELQKTRLLP